jgi:predicted transcriptional regulator
MIQGTMSAFEYFVKQLDYQVQTLEMILSMKEEGKSAEDISEFVGVSPSEVNKARPKHLEVAKKDLNRYERRLKRGL